MAVYKASYDKRYSIDTRIQQMVAIEQGYRTWLTGSVGASLARYLSGVRATGKQTDINGIPIAEFNSSGRLFNVVRGFY